MVLISFSIILIRFYAIKKPGGLTVSSRANGKIDVKILMSHYFEAHGYAVGRSSHIICPGV